MTTNFDNLYIGGNWTTPSGPATITVTSPATEEVIGTVPEGAEADIDRAIVAARSAFDDPTGWSQYEPRRRAEILERFADALDKRGARTAEAVSRQNGMPIQTSQSMEAVFPALLLRYYARLVKESADERRPAMFGGTTVVRREPVGVVAAIVPWNFPQALAFTKIAPALAAGCTVVMKPSPETVLDSYIMIEAAMEAGLPAGVLNVVQAGAAVGAYLVAHPGVDKVAFTGSTAAGRSIAETCGRLLRPVTLELGGKSAAIVLDDVDLGSRLEEFFPATLFNNGQTCFLSTRILAPRARYNELVDTISDFAASLTVGDPLDPATQIGPVVSVRQRERVESYIAKGAAEGARVTAGGGRPADHDRGYFISPTVFADVDNHHTIAQEEIFGPVLALIPYDDVDQAVAMANDSEFGLGGSVWSEDPERALSVANRVRTGSIGINSYVNDPASPFGGIKASGMGREMGPEGLSGFQLVKSMYNAP
ncbi:aldehyde dehydrogenase [Rhodococcus sp. NPDC019627]|uniref:aldehyde dehydrogenase n=1 Tax=unclassified Rhodococcus (in: high G+C Gram-positive bacteria) TaxID=192944 RepID=UPI00340F37F1